MSTDHSTITNKNETDRNKKLASILSLVFGAIILGLKFYAYHVTNSRAIFSDALESIVNVVAGIITMIVLFISARPADDDHPYGHGKVESMAATFEGGAILFAGVLIIIDSVQTFFHGAEVKELNLGLIIVLVAGLINGLMGLGLQSRGNKYHSEALRSSGAHLLTDAYTSAGVLIGLFLVKLTGLQWIDPIIASLFGVMLIVTGGKILIQSGNTLLDGQNFETLKLLMDLFEKHHQAWVIHIHFTRVIRSGAHHHVDCHMVVPEFWTIDIAHEYSNEYERMIMKEYPVHGELNVHLDPCRKAYCESCELNECPIRKKPFVARVPFNLEELISPTESR
jgi:cation diffusion facilitator family transporter